MLKLVWDISVLKQPPETMPYSKSLMLGLACVNFSILFLLIAIASGSIASGIWKAVLMLAIVAMVTRLALDIAGYPERFVQIYSSLLACQSLVMVLLLVPYFVILIFLPDMTTEWLYMLGLGICVVLLFALCIWLFLIYARVFREAMAVSTTKGLLAAILVFGINLIVFGLLP